MKEAECPFCHHFNRVDLSDLEGDEKQVECTTCEFEFTVYLEDGYLRTLDPEYNEIIEDDFYIPASGD